MTTRKVYPREAGSNDGVICNVSNVANGNVSYTYLDFLREGYKHGSISHIISNTTLTIELCNDGSLTPNGQTLEGVATANNAGTSITASALTSIFSSNDDLNQLYLRIIEDATTPANVGLQREIVDYDGATGEMTLSSSIGAINSGVTKFLLIDNPNPYKRKVSDPTSSAWRDVTQILTGAATHTTSGTWFLDTDIIMERIRIKRVATNNSNSCVLRSSRGR